MRFESWQEGYKSRERMKEHSSSLLLIPFFATIPPHEGYRNGKRSYTRNLALFIGPVKLYAVQYDGLSLFSRISFTSLPIISKTQ
jgi:hypothetical protein